MLRRERIRFRSLEVKPGGEIEVRFLNTGTRSRG